MLLIRFIVLFRCDLVPLCGIRFSLLHFFFFLYDQPEKNFIDVFPTRVHFFFIRQTFFFYL